MIMDKEIRKFIRGDETIKTKVTIDFSGGYYRTIPEIEIIKKIIKEKNGEKKKKLNLPK